MLTAKKIILGSSSLARKQLMQSLAIPFISVSPNVDETPLPNEAIQSIVKRLSIAKARAVQQQHPNALVIGCDQLGCVGDYLLTKPNDHAHALEQLRIQSGNEIIFYTAIALLDGQTNALQTAVEEYRVFFRNLTQAEMEAYLRKDTPYQCAGSLRADGLGITLIEKFSGNDFTALIGLPLIRLSQMLRNAGVDLYPL